MELHAPHYTGGWKNMVYKRFTTSVIFQLILILANLVCIAFLFFILDRNQYIYTFIVLLSTLSFQVYYLIRFLTRTNRELSKFIDAIKQEDFSLKYPSVKNKGSIADLHEAFNAILEAFQQVKIDREMQFNFLQLIVEHIEIGIIAINENQEIVLMNTATEKLLGIHKSKTWRQLKIKADFFCNEVENIFSGGKKLIETKLNNSSLNLSIEVINTTLQGKAHKLITINDIKKEIEQKELDAWIKLIRVLNHEIMNSTTPISSLTETIIMLLEDKKTGPKPISEMNDEVIVDVIDSAKTIQKRSNGLYDFVNEYRKLTKVPPPKVEKIKVKSLIENVVKLMQSTISENDIKISFQIEPEDLQITLDPNLIEQVLINLVKNAIEALGQTKDPFIQIVSGVKEKHPFILVSDNGPGIDPGIREEIFVPFFSTKEEGSGIGLSLSRQIMRLHGGSITVQSSNDISTLFILSF